MKKQIKLNSLFLAIIMIVNTFIFCLNECVSDAYAQNLNKNDESTEVFIYTAGERRDPFITLMNKSGDFNENVPSAKEELNELIKTVKVDGILWDDQMPLVMINKEIHKIGDIINQLTVKDITDESVTFGYADLTHTITIIEKKDF